MILPPFWNPFKVDFFYHLTISGGSELMNFFSPTKSQKLQRLTPYEFYHKKGTQGQNTSLKIRFTVIYLFAMNYIDFPLKIKPIISHLK